MVKRPIIIREMVKEALAAHKLHSSVPEIIVAIINMTRAPKASIADLVWVIEQDPELYEHIIQIANSGFYGVKRKVKSLSDAIILMGWNNIKMVSLDSTVLKKMREKDQRLYFHSIRTAHIARFLADEANFYKTEEIAVVGLLHDLGITILQVYFNEEFLRAKQYALDYGIPIHIAERELLGVDHAEVGGWVIKEWHLPDNIIESVARHHSFDPNTFHARKTAVIHVADVLAFAVDYSGPAWEKVSEMSLPALEIIGFTEAKLKDMILSIMKMKFDSLVI